MVGMFEGATPLRKQSSHILFYNRDRRKQFDFARRD